MQTNNELLKQIGKPDLKYLGNGMQSRVFALDDDYVLKVYGDDIGYDNIIRLKLFYESLDTKQVLFETPSIIDVQQVGGKIIVTEKRINGICPNKKHLNTLPIKELKNYFRNYVDTLFDIQKITTTFLKIAEPLDLKGDFFKYKKYNSWNEMLIYNLEVKFKESETIFNQKVNNIKYVYKALKSKVAKLVITSMTLIHGDFFPANSMVNAEYGITAILDFGILTTVGDPIFDIALGWLFSDMYNEVTILDIKKYLKPFMQERLTGEEKKRFDLYILVYSFISANMYATNDPTNGHFNWCIHNLNNEKYLGCLF